MIKRPLLKIAFSLIIIGFSLTGLLSIGQTYAFFSDGVDSNGNIFTAGTLDLTLRSGQGNFIPPEIADDMSPGQSVTRDIYIKKEGSLPFQYNVHLEPMPDSCDLEFYDLLELKVWYNWYDDTEKHMDLKYDGLLKDFELTTDPDLQIPNIHPYYTNVFYGPDEHWLYFQIIYPSEAEEKSGGSCQFKFVFNGWQTNLPDSSSGFSDTEEIHSTLIDSIFVEEEPIIDNLSIVINEFLPNAVAYPEFIEIYNKSTSSIDLNGFYIKTNDSTIPINATTTNNIYSGGSTEIASNGWLVVTTEADQMDNHSDTITLYNSNDIEVDSYSYCGSYYCSLEPTPDETNDNSSLSGSCFEVEEDKSYARIPDGFANWVDPMPTPGASNKLDEEGVEELQLEEIIEEIPLITATTTTSTVPDNASTATSTTSTTTTTEPPKETTTTTTIPDNIQETTTTTTTTTTEPTTSSGEHTTTTTTTTTTIPSTTTTTTIPEEITTTTTIPDETTTTTTTIPDNTQETTTTTTKPTTSSGENTTATTTTTTIPSTTTTTTIPERTATTTTMTTIPEKPTATTTTTTKSPEETTTTTIPETTTTTTTIPEETTTTTIPSSTTTTTTEPATSRINIYFA